MRNVSLVKHSTRGPLRTQFRSLNVCPGFASACTLRFHRFLYRLGNGCSGGWIGPESAAPAFAAREARLCFAFLPAFHRRMASGEPGWHWPYGAGGASGGTDDGGGDAVLLLSCTGDGCTKALRYAHPWRGRGRARFDCTDPLCSVGSAVRRVRCCRMAG